MKISYNNFVQKTVHNLDVYCSQYLHSSKWFSKRFIKSPRIFARTQQRFFCMHSPPICSSPRLWLKPIIKAPKFPFIVLENINYILFKEHQHYLMTIIFILVIYQGEQIIQNSLIILFFFKKLKRKHGKSTNIIEQTILIDFSLIKQ